MQVEKILLLITLKIGISLTNIFLRLNEKLFKK